MTVFEQLTQHQVEHQVKNHPLSGMYDLIIRQVRDHPLYQVRDQIRDGVWGRVTNLHSTIQVKIIDRND
jgi:hypothetical protein